MIFSRARRILIAIGLAACMTLSLAACGQGTGEPSGSQMEQAVRAKFDAINADLMRTAQMCQRRAFRGNPMLAMKCLSVCASSGSRSCELTMALTGFQKYACQKSPTQPGFVCDYALSIDTTSPQMRKFFQAIGGGSRAQGRFVKVDGTWVFMGQ